MTTKTDVEQPALFSPDEAPKVELPAAEANPLPTTRELSKFIRYYRENIRNHSTPETTGVMRQLLGLLKKGVTMKQISTALKNYRDDPFRQTADPRHVKHIRSFFTRENIEQWQRPVVNRRGFRPRHAALDALEALQQLATPRPQRTPAPPTPIVPSDVDDVEEFTL